MVANSSVQSSRRRSLLRRPQILSASVVVSNPLDVLSIPLPLMTHLLSLLSPQARLTLLTPPLLSSIPWACKRTAASAVGDVHLDALSLLIPTPRRLRCRYWDLGLIFLLRRLHHCCQFIRTIIATPQPPPLSPHPFRLVCRLWSLRRVVYSSYSADSSVVVVNSAVQSVQDYLPLGC